MLPSPCSITALDLDKRQVIGPLTTSSTAAWSCSPTPVTLAAGGILTLNSRLVTTLTSDLIFLPNCTAVNDYPFSGNVTNNEPFYASTTVLVYVVAMSTVLAWFLFLLLLIAPSHQLPKSTSKSSGWLDGRSVASMISNAPSLFHFSTRPWLQKAAAFLVTVALTIASADTFTVAAQQYSNDYTNATRMRDYVVANVWVRALRVVSDVFIWLAQVQTLIRLFPRRKEKLIIKWFGFLMILLDTIFSCLNSFYINSRELPRSYDDAIPALSYLFELSISLLYGAWVFYYVATKRRYAFYSRDMPNIMIVSILAVVSIVIPVGFFVADVTVPLVAGWGDFIRWVGAAAASVLVWEWVERIELLEREEKKSGILGREIFEEDEVFDGNNSLKKYGTQKDGLKRRKTGHLTSRAVDTFVQAAIRLKPRKRLKRRASTSTLESQRAGATSEEHNPVETQRGHPMNQLPIQILPPTVQSDTPVSRTDTDTPSTVYAVHYHPVTTTPPVSREPPRPPRLGQIAESATTTSTTQVASTQDSDARQLKRKSISGPDPPAPTAAGGLRGVRRSVHYAANVFKRGKKSPPLEIKQALSLTAHAIPQQPSDTDSSRHASATKRRLSRFVGFSESREAGLPAPPEEPTVIPAPPRGHAWSPGMMRHSPVELRGTGEHREVVSLAGVLRQSTGSGSSGRSSQRQQSDQGRVSSSGDDPITSGPDHDFSHSRTNDDSSVPDG